MVLRSPRSRQRIASSITTRMAWDGSGAGMIPSVRANWSAASKIGILGDRHRLDELLVVERADQRRHPVIPEATGVNRRRDERVAQGVHLHQRGGARRVPEVVAVLPLGQTGARRRFHRHDPEVRRLPGQLVLHEGKGEPTEGASAADASHQDVRILPQQLELPLRLQADDGLMHQDVVQDAAQRILGVPARGGVLDRFADRDAEAARRGRILGQDGAAGLGVRAGAGHHVRSPGLHHQLSVRLVLVADLHHVDLALQAELPARQRQGAPPLARARLRGEPLHALALVVVRLGNGRVRLVASCRADPFPFVVDAGGRLERLLQPVGPVERRGTPEPVDVSDRFGNRDPAVLADLLRDEAHGKQRRQIVRPDGPHGPRMDHRRKRKRKVRLEVVPLSRKILLRQHHLGFGHRHAPVQAAVS